MAGAAPTSCLKNEVDVNVEAEAEAALKLKLPVIRRVRASKKGQY